MTRQKNSLKSIQSLANLIPDPERAEDATDRSWWLLYEEGAKVRVDEVKDGLEPGWWTAWDELEKNGVAESYLVA